MSKHPASPPPAYFLSLSLENVRSFGDKQTISFAQAAGRPAQWTIILGDNGVGKTTVLKSLVAVTPSLTPIGTSNIHEPRFYADLMQYQWLPIRNEHAGSIQSIYHRGKLSDEALIMQDEKDNPNYSGFSFHLVDANYPYPSGRSSSFEAPIPPLICYSYGASRSTGTSTLGEKLSDTSVSLFDDHADLLNAEEWFLSIDYNNRLSGKNSKELQRARDIVEDMLKKVLLGVTDLRIASTGTPQKPQISLQFLLFDTWVRLRDMSLGYQTLVAWLTDFANKLLIRYPDSPNPLEMPAIVLIDEIDLHLHPSWQRRLIGFLSDIFKNTQFIATAHSPLVVQAAGDAGANIVLLKRKDDQTIVHQDLEDVRNWRIDQILSSELFDEMPAHSPDTEAKLRRRDALLAKSRLTAKDKKALADLNEWAHGQPVGDSAGERQAADVLRELARKLGKQQLLD